MRADGNIDGFAALLGQAGLDLGAEEMADALWLAGYINSGISEQVTEEEVIEEQSAEPTVREDFLDSELKDDVQLPLSLPSKQDSGSTKPDGIPIKAPAAPALRIRLELARALQPLRRRVPSLVRMEFDQAATIERIADQGIWSPVLSPAPERWLELALVSEESKSAPLWKKTLAEFQTLLEQQGAFRTVSFWRLKSSETGELTLLSGNSNRLRSARELLDPAGRRLILVVSDCTSVAWQRGTIYPWLKTWGEQAPMTVIQLLPERLWAQTGLAHGTPMWLNALEPGVPIARMMATAQMPLWDLFGAEHEQVTVPVVSLETEPLKQWANVVTGAGQSRMVGFRFEKSALQLRSVQDSGETEGLVQREAPQGGEQSELSAEERVRLFRATASVSAQKLAGLMSAAPVSPPIVNLIRQTMLPEAELVHMAEVYMGGLMEAQANETYEFIPEVRGILLDAVSITDTKKVLDRVSSYISEHIGLNTRSFETLLQTDIKTTLQKHNIIQSFAQISTQVLKQMGGEYTEIADHIRMQLLSLSLPVSEVQTTLPASEVLSVTEQRELQGDQSQEDSVLERRFHEQQESSLLSAKASHQNTIGGGMFAQDGEFFANRQATRAEREVYSYIRCLARLENSEEAIEAFYSLLFKGVVTHRQFDTSSVRTALVSVLESPDANEILPYVINRCFYTLVNPWRLKTHRHGALRDLVDRAKNLPERRPNSSQIKRLVVAMDSYVNSSNLYISLQRQMRLLSDVAENATEKQDSFGSCFGDYFFIYESAAVTRDIPLQYRKSIQQQRQKKAKQINQQLNAYWQAHRRDATGQVTNPTRLTPQQLTDAIHTFHPNRKNSYRHQAKTFETGLTDFRTTKDFVDPFFDYIMEPLVAADARYQTNRFSKLVKDVLVETAGQGKTPLTGISLNQMCTRLLKMLVSNTVDRPEMMHFRKLVETVGAKVITAVLLKIVLFRRTIRSWFEDRFGILFHVRESCSLDKVSWLVDSFEYMNVALALNAPWLNYMPKPAS